MFVDGLFFVTDGLLCFLGLFEEKNFVIASILLHYHTLL
jgi:hypothetical protein